MKFMFFFYPAIPGTLDEREKLRPSTARTDRFQQMLSESVELSQFAEDLGFSAVTFPEHHLHTEGGEMGSLPLLTRHVLADTKKIMAGPIGSIRRAAREGLIPTLLGADYVELRRFAELHVEGTAKHGRQLKLGENLGAFRGVDMADIKAQAHELAMKGLMGTGWPGWAHYFGSTDAFRLPEDDLKYPGQTLPLSEIKMERFDKAHFALSGNASDVRRDMDDLVAAANPEWFIWQGDQGYLPLDDCKRIMERFAREVMPHYV